MGPRSPLLLVETPSGTCVQVHVPEATFVIGRLQACDLTLTDNRISRRHARIRLEGTSVVLEDLGSRHGLTVNGERVRSRRLVVGDRIGFGMEDSYHLTVCDSGNPQDPLLKRVAGLPATGSRTGALGRLSAVLDVARTMAASEDVGPVFEAVVEAALTIAGADRAFLLLRDEQGELRVKVARDANAGRSQPPKLGVPRSVISDALDRRRQLFSVTIGPRSERAQELLDRTDPQLSIQSALCVPVLRIRIGDMGETSVISTREDTLGVLFMDTRNPAVRLADGNQALLQALAIEISTILENARLIAEEREKHRLEQEIFMARRIQRALLPAVLPSEGWLVARGHCESSSQLGGDYYDVMQVAPAKWVAVVADVAGKGIAASLLASLLQGAFFLGSGPEVSLAGTLQRINVYLCERSDQTRFATVFVLLIDDSGAVRWSSAGHCPALLVRARGSVEHLGPTSRPVGLLHDAEFAEDTCQLLPGDKLVVYSDGLTERLSPLGEEFGEQRVREAVAGGASLDTAGLFTTLLDRVRGHAGDTPRRDDLTLLVLGYQSPGDGPGSAPSAQEEDPRNRGTPLDRYGVRH